MKLKTPLRAGLTALALVAALAGPAPADSLVDDVLRRGQGSPFFIEQLLAAARDAAPVGASDEVPAGIGRLLGNRVRSVSEPASELAAANALDQFVRQMALRLIGPALGGVIVASVGAGLAFAVDAATFLISAGAVM